MEICSVRIFRWKLIAFEKICRFLFTFSRTSFDRILFDILVVHSRLWSLIHDQISIVRYGLRNVLIVRNNHPLVQCFYESFHIELSFHGTLRWKYDFFGFVRWQCHFVPINKREKIRESFRIHEGFSLIAVNRRRENETTKFFVSGRNFGFRISKMAELCRRRLTSFRVQNRFFTVFHFSIADFSAVQKHIWEIVGKASK